MPQTESTAANNKRIAKNTLLLYFRMIFTMAITLYTSRVVLKAIGVEDFGIYNVVGGIVLLLSFVNSSLIGASARFITFSQGTNDQVEIKKTFDSILTIHLSFAVLILILAETVGLWFVQNELVYPASRSSAVMWVYQSAVFAAMIEFISTPYNSLIVAHERMSAFAYVSIYDKCIQLLIVFSLFYIPYDRLVIYSMLIVAAKVSVQLIYTIYCKRNFQESHFSICFEKERLKKIFIYAGWIFNGNLAYLGYTQGLNILLNIYFGPIVNAARGISQQVQSAILAFTTNFQTAINPQIIKSYAGENLDRMHKLILFSSRFGFFLMTIIVVPIFVQVEYILNLWLTDVPEYSAQFVRISLILGLNSSLRNPTITGIQATGNVKRFQLWEGSILLMVLPISYMLLKFFHINPVQTLSVYLAIDLFVQFVRVLITYPQINLKVSLYFKAILSPCLKVIIVSFIACYILSKHLIISSFWDFALYTFLSISICLIFICLIGLNDNEIQFIKRIIMKHFLQKK